MPETKTCANCGAKNPSSNNFCEQCGAKLTGQTEKNQPKSQSSSKQAKNIPVGTAPLREKAPSLPLNRSGLSISWMAMAYTVLLLIAVFTRFDHLGNKPHHHDESMHSAYSAELFQDGNYKYDPMLHGPFQFHGNALMYYLFGVSPATSRFLAASFGILTVVLAMLLGPFLGRWGAFLATLLIVISPSFMYFDRFTREDAYVLGGTFLWVVFLFRYYRSRLPSDLWWAALGFVIAFCTKESIFITIAVLGTYLFIRLLPWLDVLIAGGLTAFGMSMTLVLEKGNPARMPVLMLCLAAAFAYTVVQIAVRWIEYTKKPKSAPPVWDMLLGLEAGAILWELVAYGLWWVLAILVLRICPHFGISVPLFFSALLLFSYFGLLIRFGWLWLKNVSPALTGSLSICSIIFTLLFTTFFTVGADQGDLWSRFHELLEALYRGAFGGLEYWWGQHDVHRGDEPWFYYLLQLPANEMVSFLFSFIGILYYGFFKRQNIPLFLAYWYVGSLALFSWAGEKMPWLILHPLLPSLLLSAYLVGQAVESVPAGFFGRTVRTAIFLVFGLLTSYSLHSAVLLSFYHESNPVESLVYVQSGPDCLEVEKIVRRISYGETGGPNPEAPAGISDGEKAFHDGLALTIESTCSWPFAWNFRDFPKRNHPDHITMADNPIILTGVELDHESYPILSTAGYVNRKYKLRTWWIPSWYKKGYPAPPITLPTFLSWLGSNFLPFGTAKPDMVDWNDLKNWILYRKVWSDLGSMNMRLWVRKDLAERYGFTGTDRTDIPSDFPQPLPAPESPMEKKGKKHRSGE
ncbi:MAG TPA: flippase activity-associated protein Agl23 [bacterium]|nr:flippase activity-associated protein Agl23 [bacterium]